MVAAFAASRLVTVAVPSEREYDEGVYLLSARAVNHGHELFSDVFSSQPPAFLESLALSMRVAGDSLETGRVFILCFGLLALGSIASIARRLYGIWAAPVAAAGLAIGATFLDLSHLVQAELPSLAIALASLAACLEARAHSWSRGWLIATGALFALAALFKLFIVPFAVPLAFLLLLAPERDDDPAWSLDGRGLLLLQRAAGRMLLVAGGAVAIGCIPLFCYDIGALFEQTVSFQLVKHEVYELNRQANLMRCWKHIASEPTLAISAAVGGLWLIRHNRLIFAWLLGWLVASLFVLMEQTPLFWRHFVLLAPIVVLAATSLLSPLTDQRGLSSALLVTMSLLGVWSYPSIATPAGVFPLIPQRQSEETQATSIRAVAAWIGEHSDAGDLVAGDDPMAIYLAGRQSPPGLCDSSRARINSQSLTLAIAREQSATARIIVLRDDGRLSRLPGYPAWLAKNYSRENAPPGTLRSFWVRTAAPGHTNE
ncbi:MAG TPA: glycosyltransferase family 39 protein [Candidatus Limnocylindrales bacterium]|nr:glycosyltransferase family 39 protein [Candidatus Limnocylindrales bacterium]